MAAYVLVKQLIALLEPGKRRMDLCECHMLLAIIYYKSGDQDRMCEELETTLTMAKKYRYIRLLADEGICMVQMLPVYQREKGADAFTDQIIELAREREPVPPQLSERAIGILRNTDRNRKKGAADDGIGNEQR